MKKISLKPTNDYCPQTLFLYGTYDEEGNPDFGLFCWFSYTWNGEMGAMCCIGGDKLTKQNIMRNRIFSANLVTEELLPLADHLGNVKGEDPAKMKVPMDIGKGAVLDVPVLNASPVIFELEVIQTVPLHDGDVILCRIRNVLQDEALADDKKSAAEKLMDIAPVRTTCKHYYGYKGEDLGAWGEPRARL